MIDGAAREVLGVDAEREASREVPVGPGLHLLGSQPHKGRLGSVDRSSSSLFSLLVTLVNSCSWFSQVARGGSSAPLEQSTSPSHT